MYYINVEFVDDNDTCTGDFLQLSDTAKNEREARAIVAALGYNVVDVELNDPCFGLPATWFVYATK